MPKAAPSPCRSPVCANTVNADQRGYCDKHASNRGGFNNRQDKSGSTTDRGYGYAWQKLRKKILIRDNYLCQECLRNDRTKHATDVDHIKRKQDGGSDDPANLESLCNGCHKHKTATEGRVGKKSF